MPMTYAFLLGNFSETRCKNTLGLCKSLWKSMSFYLCEHSCSYNQKVENRLDLMLTFTSYELYILSNSQRWNEFKAFYFPLGDHKTIMLWINPSEQLRSREILAHLLFPGTWGRWLRLKVRNSWDKDNLIHKVETLSSSKAKSAKN